MAAEGRKLTEFTSKAHVLETLSGVLEKSSIEALYRFSESEWARDSIQIIERIKNKFKGETIIIRSSALVEDTILASHAGAFKSVLFVDSNDEYEVRSAIEQIIGSYHEKEAGNPDNPILVQKQSLNVSSSGVVLTRDYNNSPYYVVNYSEGRDTAAVTGGQGSQSVKILRRRKTASSNEPLALLEAVQEIEGLTPANIALNIEYGIKGENDIITFQVRPLTSVKEKKFTDSQIESRVAVLQNKFDTLTQPVPHLFGKTTSFGDMPDWNPAEIIGASPHPLAISLYDEIITGSVWHKARTSQGYMNVNPAKLVIAFGNKPYVDVRNSFNSFLPANLSAHLKEKLVDFYLAKLQDNPQFQDKVEFDILFTCYDFLFSARAEELLNKGFNEEEVAEIKRSLLKLTNRLLKVDLIRSDLKRNEQLEAYRTSLPVQTDGTTPTQRIERALQLLDNCKIKGTLPFARLARLAFIGKTILESLIKTGNLSEETYNRFLRSIETVASDFANDLDLLNQGKLSLDIFLEKYGHLRPGTYDIRIPRYDHSSADYFSTSNSKIGKNPTEKQLPFLLNSTEEQKIKTMLKKHGLKISAKELFRFARMALEAREYSKFLFSRSLSDAIELLASAGETMGFSREDLSYLEIDTIKAGQALADNERLKDIWAKRIAGRKEMYELNQYVSLPAVIFTRENFELISHYASQPNYITTERVQNQIVVLTGDEKVDVEGKIVVLEAADPGYDWLFAKRPAGLITKYGGPASHMAVRCAELGLPAIIGAGEALFSELLQSSSVIIDCGNQRAILEKKLK